MLARYGSITQTLYEFLRHCHCDKPRYTPAFEALARYLVTFLPFAELRTQTSGTPPRRTRIFAQSRGFLGSLGLLLVRIQTVMQSFAWRPQRAHLQRECDAICRKLHQDWRADVRRRLAAVTPAMQTTIAEQIAWRMWLQSFQLLVDTYVELSHSGTPGSLQPTVALALELFDEALEALERNHDQFQKGG